MQERSATRNLVIATLTSYHSTTLQELYVVAKSANNQEQIDYVNTIENSVIDMLNKLNLLSVKQDNFTQVIEQMHRAIKQLPTQLYTQLYTSADTHSSITSGVFHNNLMSDDYSDIAPSHICHNNRLDSSVPYNKSPTTEYVYTPGVNQQSLLVDGIELGLGLEIGEELMGGGLGYPQPIIEDNTTIINSVESNTPSDTFGSGSSDNGLDSSSDTFGSGSSSSF